MKNIIILVITISMAGCVSPKVDKTLKYTSWDKRTSYNVTETYNGFDVAIIYSKYQFIPNFYSMFDTCKQKSYFVAQEEAKKRKKMIFPIDFKTLNVSMGRNAITGVTSCTAHLKVYWDATEVQSSNKSVHFTPRDAAAVSSISAALLGLLILL